MSPFAELILHCSLILLFCISIIVLLVQGALYWSRRVSKRGRVLVHVPTIWTLRSLHKTNRELMRTSKENPGFYIPCRPVVHIGGLRHRLRCAWLAFTGRCDLVRWPEGQ